jgi:cbb3-type cytochrome oxidase subunit 3
MRQAFLANFPFMSLAVIGQLLFFTVFVAAVLWVFRTGSKSFYEKLAALPLDQVAHGKEKQNG